MISARATTLLGISLTASVLFLAGCATDGAGNDAARCGGRAYDNVMFNTDQYDPEDRVRVSSALRDAGEDDVTDDILRRVTNVTGDGNARRIADEFRSCLAG